MKKCAKCGYENLDEALFCAECGHELSSSSSNSNPRRNISFKQIKNNFKRHPYLHICCLFPMILFAMFTIAHDAQGFYKEMHAEDYETNYPEEYYSLDINNDGKLEFNETLPRKSFMTYSKSRTNLGMDISMAMNMMYSALKPAATTMKPNIERNLKKRKNK